MEVALKILLACCTVLSVATALYNVVTNHRHARQRDHDNRQAAQLEATAALAIRTEQRVHGLEGRVGSFEQRIENRLSQMASDITQVKDLFTNYLINKP